jgi:restriction endonuclease S subunit
MEYECREEYKVTELGELPQEWEVKELSEITTVITKGTTPTTYGYDFIDEGVNFVKIESVNDSTGKLIPENLEVDAV